MESIDERSLIKRCRCGDKSAFGPLIKIYRRQLFSYFFKLCGDSYAEDILQETLIKVWRAFSKYDERNKFSSWLFSIAHNTAMDELRKRNRDLIKTREEPDSLTSAADPHDQLVESEAIELVSAAIDKLPVKQRNVFLLRVHGGMTFKEIAVATGEPLNTVLSHMNYSVKKIRKYIGTLDAK